MINYVTAMNLKSLFAFIQGHNNKNMITEIMNKLRNNKNFKIKKTLKKRIGNLRKLRKAQKK